MYDKNKPDFVNEKGTKWWFDKTSTQYARKKDLYNISLKDVSIFMVEETNGVMSYVIVSGNDIIYESQQLEAIGVHIDLLKTLKQRKRRNK